MGEISMQGLPAAPGTAAGAARLLGAAPGASGAPVPLADREAELGRARRALRAAADQLEAITARLRGEGRTLEAAVVETGVMMALDPSLDRAVEEAITERGRSAGDAILDATETAAAAIAAVDDPVLAARAADARSLGRRAARLTAETTEAGLPGGEAAPVVIVAPDLGPADVAELGQEVAAIALAEGGVRAHAAIVARSLGLPMVVGVGDELLEVSDGDPLVVDGDTGVTIARPSAELRAGAMASAERRRLALERSTERRDLQATTLDGRRLSVLANVASGGEVALALSTGAEGAGLIRTELAFLDARAWPTEAEHRAELEPILSALRGRVATVRVLDFGGDKTPPFLAGSPARGLELLLEAPERLEEQLRAILSLADGVELRLLLPMVRDQAQVTAARAALERALAATGAHPPALGAMIETPDAAEAAVDIARHVEFMSVGTNDLTAAVLGVSRFTTGEALPYHPAVLAAIAAVTAAGKLAGLPVEVCGEAASDPLTVPLLVGLGVEELSVGAARVGIVREWVRSLRYDHVRALARRCLAAASAVEAAAIARPLARSLEVLEGGDASGQSVNGAGGVVAVGPQS
jgi:phosphoenolpyruvate-protein kinase (PTS system EI component)